jgi:hypothetical protein
VIEMNERMEYVIDVLETLQDSLEVLDRDDVYDVLDEVIRILMMSESDT